MFAALADEVENLPITADSAGLIALLAIRDRLDAVVSDSVAAFDAAGGWDGDAATSMPAWLRDRAGMTSRSAARTVSVARRLWAMPVTREAWRAGALSSGQVDVVVAHVAPRLVPLFSGHEDALIPTLAGLSTRDTTLAMNDWRIRAEALLDRSDGDPPVDDEPTRTLHLSELLDGRGALDGDLDADTFQWVRNALRVAETKDLPEEPQRTPAERRADALADICKFFLDHQQQRSGGRHRPHLNVIVDTETGTARYVDGPSLSGEVLGAFLCDSALHRLLMAGRSAVLDYGMSTRTIPAPLWATLVVRDEHCRFPGCDRPATWCDGHHITWFSRLGPTRPDNLVLLCRRHHKRLHQPGWHAKLLPDATFEVTTPAGTIRASHPPGTLQPFW